MQSINTVGFWIASRFKLFLIIDIQYLDSDLSLHLIRLALVFLWLHCPLYPYSHKSKWCHRVQLFLLFTDSMLWRRRVTGWKLRWQSIGSSRKTKIVALFSNNGHQEWWKSWGYQWMRRAVSSGFSLIFICEIILGIGVKEIKADFTFDSSLLPPIAFMILGARDLVRTSEGRVKNPISLEFALPLPLAVLWCWTRYSPCLGTKFLRWTLTVLG